MSSEARHGIQLFLLCLLHASVILVLLWDVYALYHDHPGETVSSILRSWSQAYPEILIPVGYLLCHLFGR